MQIFVLGSRLLRPAHFCLVCWCRRVKALWPLTQQMNAFFFSATIIVIKLFTVISFHGFSIWIKQYFHAHNTRAATKLVLKSRTIDQQPPIQTLLWRKVHLASNEVIGNVFIKLNPDLVLDRNAYVTSLKGRTVIAGGKCTTEISSSIWKSKVTFYDMKKMLTINYENVREKVIQRIHINHHTGLRLKLVRLSAPFNLYHPSSYIWPDSHLVVISAILYYLVLHIPAATYRPLSVFNLSAILSLTSSIIFM